MLINNQPPAGVYQHNYVRLAFLVGALLLFIGYVAVVQIYEDGRYRKLERKRQAKESFSFSLS